MYRNVFSEFEVRSQYIKVSGSDSFVSMSCVGSSEESLEVKVVTKNCRGELAEEVVMGAGNGTLTESLHVPYEIYNAIYDMTHSTEVAGVYSYGQLNTHPEFALTQEVYDETGDLKYKAYPRCIIESGPNRPVTNGQTEVPELSLTITLLPDDYGQCMYECLVSETDSTITDAWLEGFTSDLVQATA